MKHIVLLATILLTFVATSVFGRGGCFIKNRKGKILTVDAITASPSGVLTYKSGAITSKIKGGKYIWAWIPKPKDIKIADKLLHDKKNKEAVIAFKKLAEKYKYLGWDIYSILAEAKALQAMGEKDKAIKTLAPLEHYKLINPTKMEQDLMKAYMELASLYIDAKNYDVAKSVLSKLGEAHDATLAAFAFNAKGSILNQQGKKKDAVLMYLQTALLFPRSNPERPEALLQVANILTDMNDKRSDKFKTMLKAEYPKSKKIQDLK